MRKIFKFILFLIWNFNFGFNKKINNYKNISKNCIFIISLPRSGSTFFFNKSILELNFSYISNINLLFPNLINKPNYNILKSISYGFTKNIYGPSEFGANKLNFYKPNKKFELYLKSKTKNKKYIIFKNTNFIFNLPLILKIKLVFLISKED